MVNPYVSTVANSDVNTVVNPDMDTPSKETTLSMVSSDLSTVFEENTRFKNKDLLLERTTATEALLLDSAEIRREFARHALVPDQRALAAMIAACQQPGEPEAWGLPLPITFALFTNTRVISFSITRSSIALPHLPRWR